MAITFFCSACGAKLRGRDDEAGGWVVCRGCGADTRVPYKPLGAEGSVTSPTLTRPQPFVPERVETPGSIAVRHMGRHAANLQAFLAANFGSQRPRRFWNDRVVLTCVGVNMMILAAFLAYVTPSRPGRESAKSSVVAKAQPETIIEADERLRREGRFPDDPPKGAAPATVASSAPMPLLGSGDGPRTSEGNHDPEKATTQERPESNAANEESDQETTVYVTASGSKYHTAGCRYLAKSSIPMTLADATSGYGACSVCRPPTRQSARTAVASGASKKRTNADQSNSTAYEPPASTSPSVGTTPTGIPLHVGPRGGVYHYSASGKKVYQRKKK